MNTFNLIIGKGQVGQALHYYLKDCVTIDENDGITSDKVNYMHVAFPFNEKFVDEVVKYNKRFNPSFIVIHATVEPGTTRAIQKKTKKAVFYTPIIGQHNELEDSLKHFDKFIAFFPKDEGGAHQLLKYFRQNGINAVVITDKPEELELAKLLGTTRYAINLAFTQEQARICDKYNLDYDTVVIEFEKNFNMGTINVNRPELIRPLLFPGHIGGHCLMPNIKILRKWNDSKFFKLIEESNNQWEKEKGNE